MRYFTVCRETWDFIDEFDTYEDCKNAILEYEAYDKDDDSYEPDFYDIVDEDHRSYMTNDDYMDLDNGVSYSLDELYLAYKQAEDDLKPQYQSFDDYFEAMMSLGRQGIGGWIKVE